MFVLLKKIRLLRPATRYSMSSVGFPDPSVDLRQYLAQYDPALHLHRALRVAQLLILEPERKGALRASAVASYGHVVSTVLELLVTTSANTDLYRATTNAFFECGFDVTVDNDVVKQMDNNAARAIEKCQDLVGKAHHAVEGSNSGSPQHREQLVEVLLQQAKVFYNSGDLQRAAKAMSLARTEAADSDVLRIRYLQSQILSLFTAWGPSLSPQAAHGHVSSLEKLVSTPILTRGTVNASRSGDASFVFFVVANSLSEMDRRNYRSVAESLKTINRYPQSAAASLAPQVAAEYTQLAATYLAQLPKLVLETQLTTLSDFVRITTLCLFATHSRAEVQSVVSLGYLKGWLEEDFALNMFVEHMLGCRYRLALRELDELLVGSPFRFELHSSISSSSPFSAMGMTSGRIKGLSHQECWAAQIQQSALAQYTSPYLTLSLPSMAAAFGITEKELELQLRLLIEKGLLHCRIDTAAQLLRHKEVDARQTTFKAVSEAGDRIVHERLMCARMQSMQRNDVVPRAILEAKRHVGAGSVSGGDHQHHHGL